MLHAPAPPAAGDVLFLEVKIVNAAIHSKMADKCPAAGASRQVSYCASVRCTRPRAVRVNMLLIEEPHLAAPAPAACTSRPADVSFECPYESQVFLLVIVQLVFDGDHTRREIVNAHPIQFTETDDVSMERVPPQALHIM